MKTIDKNSRIPVYVQLMNILIDQIKSGALGEDDKIPAERELCDKYSISRTTVRQAIQELEKERYIYIQRGKGTFVSPRQYKQELFGFYSFTEEMKKLGKVPSSKVIDFEVTYCDESIAEKMGKAVGDKIFRFARLRFADNEPMMIVTSCIPYERFPGFSREELEVGSLYENFANKYNVLFTKAKELLQSVATRKTEAEMLKTKVGFPSMLIERTTYENEQIIEYSIGIARGDKFKYDIMLNK